MAISDTHLLALLETSKEINSIQNLENLLERILDIALQHLGAERGFVLLLDAKSGKPYPAAARNIDPDKSSDLTEISSSTVRRVLDQQKPLLAFDTQSDVQVGSSKSVILQKIASIACVPLKLKGTLIGTIYIDSRGKTASFTQQSLDFLEAFANQAAIAIENVRLNEALRDENAWLKSELHRINAFDGLIGKTEVMQQVFQLMGRVVNNNVTVLLTGETGTGKEVVARAIHSNGQRKNNPFIAINCAAIPETLLESELFGHKKGAFTGAISDKKGLIEAAEAGTLFLDEIGDMPANVQVKFLRFIQERAFNPVGSNLEKKVDLRLIAATNKNLQNEVKKGSFREDLFYRLNVINIELPALRERTKDIPLLVKHFLAKFSKQYGPSVKKVTPEAMDKLLAYSWPGNVRELENALERAVILAGDVPIETEHIVLQAPSFKSEIESGMTLDEISDLLLKKTLKACNGNKTQAAKAMGVSLRWVHYRLKKM